MTPLLPLNAILIGLVAATSFTVMIYWHFVTKGTWKHEPAGRSLMILLLVIGIITANSAVNIFIPRYPGRIALYFGLYIVMLAALIGIGFTIRSEMRRGKAQLQSKLEIPRAGTVTVTTVVTTDEDIQNRT